MNNRTLVKNLAAASRRPRHRLRMGRDRARPEEGAVRHPARRVGRRAARAPRDSRGRREADAEAPIAWRRPRRSRRSRTARSSRVTGDLKHDERVKLGGIEVKIGSLEVVAEANPETPDRRRLEPRQAHGLALPRPAPPEAEPDLPHADHVPARAAHLVGRERLHRDPHAEAHGQRLGVARRAVRGGLLRGHGVPRAEPAVLQADGAAGRLRQGVRGRARVPRRPLVHLAPRHRVHLDRRRDELDRLARRRHEDARGAARRRRSPR